jgi:N-methylhydantoinase A
VRYFRQGYEFSLEVNPDTLAGGGLDDLASRFGAAHDQLYGFRLEQPVELVNLRAVGTGKVNKIKFPEFELGGPDCSSAIIEQNQVYFDGGFVATNIYDRNKLTGGNQIFGPAILTQKDTTIVIHPGHVGEVDKHLNILIHREGEKLASQV